MFTAHIISYMIPSGQVGHLHLKCGRNLVQAQREGMRSIFPQAGLRCGRCWMARRRARFTTRPETAVSRPHTDSSRVEHVDRVESVAPLDAKRPYSTLMFSRKERKGRKERTSWDALRHLVKSCGFPSKITTVKGVSPRNFYRHFSGLSTAAVDSQGATDAPRKAFCAPAICISPIDGGSSKRIGGSAAPLSWYLMRKFISTST